MAKVLRSNGESTTVMPLKKYLVSSMKSQAASVSSAREERFDHQEEEMKVFFKGLPLDDWVEFLNEDEERELVGVEGVRCG